MIHSQHAARRTGALLRRHVMVWLVAGILLVCGWVLAGQPLAANTPLRPADPPVMVLTRANDNAHTGANLNETVLGTTNVNTVTFGKLFTRTVDGQLYAQLLYVPNLDIPDHGVHNVIYAATMKNNVYAFDADDATLSAPLWQKNLGPAAPAIDWGASYKDILGSVGILSTPVIDPATNTLYTVALTKTVTNPGGITRYAHYLHALDITTGAEKFGGPVVITGTVPGNGMLGATVTFSSAIQMQRPALLLSNGVVYFAFGSYADQHNYHGWVMGYDAQTLQQRYIMNTSPNATNGTSVWQSGTGIAADDVGDLYLMTANGPYDSSLGNWGNSVLRIRPSATVTSLLSVADWFAAYNQTALNLSDKDLGSGGPLLIPGTNHLAGGGKEGYMYLLDRGNLGHYTAGGPDNIVQRFAISGTNLIFSTPVYWNGPNGPLIYIWITKDRLRAYSLIVTDTQHVAFKLPAVAVGSATAPQPGGMLSISANGNAAGSGIVWAFQPQTNANQALVAGILLAYNASNVSQELWNSTLLAKDAVGNFAKFNNPTIANGKVYVPTFSNQLVVYGLKLKPVYLPIVVRI